MSNDARTVVWGKRTGYHIRNSSFLTGVRVELLEDTQTILFTEIDRAGALRGRDTLGVPVWKVPELIEALTWLAGGPLTRMALEAEEKRVRVPNDRRHYPNNHHYRSKTP